ncbi:MAG: nucleotidyltransferase family protein [Eubacterium sp.]|nr:nucleotidyltransferase family protein [Eubacterium sp.]
MGVFKLGELHNVTAMITLSIKKLPIESRPPAKIMNLFNQALGMTIQSYENKIEGIDKLTVVLNENKIKHLFVKGAAIRQYYPSGEVRTSGDTDVIVENDNLKKAAEILVENGFTLSQTSDIQNVLFFNNEEYEVKNYLDGVNSDCENYFSNPFDKKAIKVKEYSYNLEPTYHLVYIISHLLRHLTTGGVGIRQLMDVDVMLRSHEIDINKFFEVVKELNIEKSSMVLISLSKEYFNTPTDIGFNIDEQLKSSLEKVILTGGVFGFAISDHATGRLVKSINSTENKGFKSPLIAFISMIFPSKLYLYRTYKYADKCHLLLPIAFFNRLFDAVFKRGKSNKKAIKNLFTNNKTAIMISDIINELDLKL